MFIEVGENQYELNTKLKTARQIELAFKMPIGKIFARIEEAEIDELLKLLALAAGKATTKETLPAFRQEIEEAWDYSDLFLAVNELIIRLTFTGDPDSIEKKLAKYPIDEGKKNEIREMLGIPLVQPQAGTGEN